MLRANIAERLLALFTTRDRASAVVGDLLELHGGGASFWWAVLHTMCGLSWRFGFGLLAAALVEFFYLNAFGWGGVRVDVSHHHSLLWAAGPLALAILLATAAAFASIRFGVFNPIGSLAVALALLTGLDRLLLWAPLYRLFFLGWVPLHRYLVRLPKV